MAKLCCPNRDESQHFIEAVSSLRKRWDYAVVSSVGIGSHASRKANMASSRVAA